MLEKAGRKPCSGLNWPAMSRNLDNVSIYLSSNFPSILPWFFFLNLDHVRVCPQMVVEKTLQSPHAEGTSCPRLVPPLRLRLAKDAWPQWGVARKSGLSSWDQFLGIFAISSPLSSWWISTHAWNHPTVFEYETIQFTCRFISGSSTKKMSFLVINSNKPRAAISWGPSGLDKIFIPYNLWHHAWNWSSNIETVFPKIG